MYKSNFASCFMTFEHTFFIKFLLRFDLSNEIDSNSKSTCWINGPQFYGELDNNYKQINQFNAFDLFMWQTPQFLPAHKHKHKSEGFVNWFSVKQTLLFVLELESVVLTASDRSLGHSLDCCSNEHLRWGERDLLERFGSLNSCHWSEGELRVNADVDADAVGADYTYHICEWWATSKREEKEKDGHQKQLGRKLFLITLNSFVLGNWLSSIGFDSSDGTSHSSWKVFGRQMISSFASALEVVALCFGSCNGSDFQDSQHRTVDCIVEGSDGYDGDVEWKCCTLPMDNNLVTTGCCNETKSHARLMFHWNEIRLIWIIEGLDEVIELVRLIKPLKTHPFAGCLAVFFGYPIKNINTAEIAVNAEQM